MRISLLHRLRENELDTALHYLPRNGRLLEIGAGTGVQAKLLAARGYDVLAIDLENSNYKEQRIWPIVDYDGVHIPAEANSFAAIFSSNTLEHIADIRSFLRETQRVLKSDGVCVHILPTFTWRLSSALVHYLRFDRVVEELGGLMRSSTQRTVHLSKSDYRQSRRGPNGGVWRWAVRRILPPRHGERGNIFTEHYYFTEHSWRQVFKAAGFDVTSVTVNHLYYTGHYILGDRLTIEARKILSSVLGSACKIYVLKKVASSSQL